MVHKICAAVLVMMAAFGFNTQARAQGDLIGGIVGGIIGGAIAAGQQPRVIYRERVYRERIRTRYVTRRAPRQRSRERIQVAKDSGGGGAEIVSGGRRIEGGQSGGCNPNRINGC